MFAIIAFFVSAIFSLYNQKDLAPGKNWVQGQFYVWIIMGLCNLPLNRIFYFAC